MSSACGESNTAGRGGEETRRDAGNPSEDGGPVEQVAVKLISGEIGADANDRVDGFRPIEYVGDLGADDQVFYVDRASPPGGDGSIEQPYRRIQDAIDASNGQRAAVLVASGQYDESLRIDGPTIILGAGIEETSIIAAEGVAVTATGGPESRLLLGWVTVRGAGGLNIENWRDVFLFHVRSQTTTEHGLALNNVNTAAVVNCDFEGTAGTGRARWSR